MLRSAGEQIIKNRLVVLETDEAEGAHQMRVGLTRLRSALRALEPLIASPLLLKLETDAQKISRAVGELRDADVLIEDIYAPVARKFPVTPGFDQLYQTLQSHRSTMQQKARQSLSGENWSGLLLGISLWPALLEREAVLKQPIETYAQKIFEKRWKQAAKYGRSMNKLALEERHAMRRSLKKLRYTSEFLAPLYDDKEVKPFIGRLKKLQDAFGYVNDARLAGRLRTICAERRGGEPDAYVAAGYVIGYHETKANQIWEGAFSDWSRLKKAASRFWRDKSSRR